MSDARDGGGEGAVHRVAVQGEIGCFSEAAAHRLLGSHGVTVSCQDFEAVIETVVTRRAEYGVVPIENSIAGPVVQGRAALDRPGLVVVATIVMPIEQSLLVIPGTPLARIRRVISHPVALAQCGAFLSRYPRVTAEAVWDTAGAAREVASTANPELAAIAGREAAAVYGLEVAVAGIGDRQDNATTFVVVTMA